MASSSNKETPGLNSEEAIVRRYMELQNELQNLFAKLQELEGEKSEHNMVVSTLEPLEASRRCYRLVGNVLVERTVKEVLPAVTANRDNLEQIVKSLSEQFEKKKRELAEFQSKYKIRYKNEKESRTKGESQQESGQGQGPGVLVQ